MPRPGGRIRVAGGAMRARLLARVSDPLRDLHGCRGCVEVLNITRAKLVANMHERMLRAGAELLFTNTAGAAPQLLDRFRMHDEAFAVSYLGAEIACGVSRRAVSEATRPVIVGDVRMPWHLPVLGFITCAEVETAVGVMVSAQVAGGVDAIRLQTSHRPEHLAAAVAGARSGMAESGRRVPMLVSIRHDLVGPSLHRDRVSRDLVSAAALAHSMGAAALSIETVSLGDLAVHHIAVMADAVEAPLFLAPETPSPVAHRCMTDRKIRRRLVFVGGEDPGQVWRLSRFMPAHTENAKTAVSGCNDNSDDIPASPIRKFRR